MEKEDEWTTIVYYSLLLLYISVNVIDEGVKIYFFQIIYCLLRKLHSNLLTQDRTHTYTHGGGRWEIPCRLKI